MSKDKNILEEAIADYNEITKVATDKAKSKLAENMSSKFEELLKEEFEKEINNLIPENGKMKNKDKSQIVSESIENIDETEEQSEIVENEEEIEFELDEAEIDNIMNDEDSDESDEIQESDDDLDDEIVEAIDAVLKEMASEYSQDSDSVETDELDEMHSDETETMEEEISDEEASELLDELTSEMNETDHVSDGMEENIDIDELPDMDDEIDIDAIADEVEESLGHNMSHENARKAGSHLNTNYEKAKRLRPAMREGVEVTNDTDIKKIVNEAIKPLKRKIDKLTEENLKLFKINKGYKDTLKEHKNNLYDMIVINTNLAHANSIMVEHTTSTEEKASIIDRFEKVKTIDESKDLFATIISELDSKKSKKSNISETLMKNNKVLNEDNEKTLQEKSSPLNNGISKMLKLSGYKENK